MNNNWQRVKLDDVCDLIAGFAFKGKDFGEEFQSKVIKIADIQPPNVKMDSLTGIDVSKYDESKLQKYRVGIGDYVFAMTGATIGKLGRIQEGEAYINQRVLTFRNNLNVCDKDFLYYVLAQPSFLGYILNHIDSETAQPNISASSVGTFEFYLPPISTQKQIANVLRGLDDKIELNNKINRNLEAQAQAIFKSWFIDFEPFKNVKFIDSALGKIPEGWVCKKLEDFVEIKRGSSPRPIQDYLSGSGYNWLKISDATSESSPFIFNIKEHIKKSGISQTVYLVAGELVLSNSATPGIPKFLDVNTCIHDGWLWFSNSKLSYEFLYLFFLHKRRDFISLGNGSVFTNLKTDIVKDALFVYPNKAVMDEFDKITKTIFENIKIRSRESQRLTQLRDALLPKLMSGELTMSDYIV